MKGGGNIATRRDLILNWSDAHLAVKKAIDDQVASLLEVGETGKGWTYLTFCRPGTNPRDLLFDVDRLGTLARENHFYLPGEVVRQHNKVVVSAASPAMGPSAQLFGLYRFLEAFGKKFADVKRHPSHDFYGKMGGLYDRAEKGRVLVIYAPGDEALLQICESIEQLAAELEVPGVRFAVRLSNGLSAIPRLLDGFHDPEYVKTGAEFYRVTDPGQFTELLDEARKDYPNYLFRRT